ncbi:hypothetical protein BIY29_04580 [Brenneria alni]|uniref:HTH lacI-type domain-containing protein n=1 Tax=Brenneria alni TaxID=71656 RepID=A0A421DRR5_9GAMM|nr:LacI family DNA-binding transcriptional regulator [Brenneria alni]RLM26895.1 hypothetical protein BIY29_04580 [Brenneria alni]
MKDVADKAGVGMMTVSRVIRAPHQVSEKLRTLVRNTIAELGYIPNKNAHLLASSISNQTVIVLPKSEDVIYQDLLEKLIESLQDKWMPYHIVYITPKSPEAEKINLIHLIGPRNIFFVKISPTDDFLDLISDEKIDVYKIISPDDFYAVRIFI